MAHEDSVVLNGVTYLIDGPVSGRAISEFSAGFKIGRATYDDREHAFFMVLEDFSGGIGFRRVDVHESLGGIWDNEGGIDVRRRAHITLPPERTTLTSGFTAPAGVGFGSDAHVMFTSSLGGTEFLHAAAGNRTYRINAARTSAATTALTGVATPDAIPTMFQWRDPDTNTDRIYALTINGALTSRYFYSTDAVAFTEGARVVWDGLVWDGKIVASMPLPAGTPWGTQGQIVAGYSTNGIDWNVDNADANISRPKWFFQGLPKWIGVAMSPWGRTAPYFLDGGKLYVLDFYKEAALPIEEVGDKTRLSAGGVFEGYIWVTDGWSVWIYDPGGSETVRRIGIYNRFGVPPTLRGYVGVHFIGGTSTMYLVMNDDTNAKMRILAYTGVGWTPITPEIATTNPISAVVGRFPVGQSLTAPSRYIDVLCNTSELSTSIKLLSFKLPTSGDIPTVGDGFFEDGPLHFVSSWMDGGFSDIKGALHRMTIDGFSLTSTETVIVEYQIDNAADSAGWTSLGTYTATGQTLWFDSTNHRGIEFRTVRFRITLNRGSTNTLTPELAALTLVYDKKPEFRSAWTFRIDVNRMVETQATSSAWSGVATPLKIWDALKVMYDIKTLVPLVIPNMEPSAVPGLNVRIIDMPATFDDFRNAVDGIGYVDISVLQPLAG